MLSYMLPGMRGAPKGLYVNLGRGLSFAENLVHSCGATSVAIHFTNSSCCALRGLSQVAVDCNAKEVAGSTSAGITDHRDGQNGGLSPPESWETSFSTEDKHIAQEASGSDERLRRRKDTKFIDKLRITAQAGRGGNGCLSKWASKSKGKFRPPDGGNGGRGGDVILQACQTTSSLSGLNYLHKAAAGGHGADKKLSGVQGKDCFVRVPPGTVVYLQDSPKKEVAEEPLAELPYWLRNPGKPWIGALDYTSEEDSEDEATETSNEALQKQRLGREIADLKSPGDQILLARGGEGGKGNAFLPTTVRKAVEQSLKACCRAKDMSAMRGRAGERVTACLEIRTIADIGLVGAPNAGKSSLLKLLSSADPKVAPYPFTTLQPQLGVVKVDPFLSLTLADIPGLIAGAARNKGLGHAFLRHISRAKALLYIVDSSTGLGEDSGPRPWEQLANLQAELRAYNEELLSKPSMVVANKVDKLKSKEDTISALERHCNLTVAPISALPEVEGFDAAAIEDLKKQLTSLVQV